MRYLRSTFVPSEERSFCLFDAPTKRDVEEANRLAEIPLVRITEGKHITAEDVSSLTRRTSPVRIGGCFRIETDFCTVRAEI